mgnify:CR=1 FL=1
MRIAITGKTGLLSTELQKIFPEIIVLDSYDYDITDPYLARKIMIKDPDVIIHAGAITDSNFVKTNPILTINTNIIGTDRKSTRLNSSHSQQSRMPSSA